jgi:hypothetical protein
VLNADVSPASSSQGAKPGAKNKARLGGVEMRDGAFVLGRERDSPSSSSPRAADQPGTVGKPWRLGPRLWNLESGASRAMKTASVLRWIVR